MNIALIYGGKSSEHEVSLFSASSVLRAIGTENTVYAIGIAKDGAWYLQDETAVTAVHTDDTQTLTVSCNPLNRVSLVPGGGCANGLQVAGSTLPVDVVFPVLHGIGGEDGTIQGLLEMVEIPYVGGGVFASSAAMDKEKTKIIWQHQNLPVVPFLCIKKIVWDAADMRDTLIVQAENELKYPLFVKPCRVGSSVGAGKAANRTELIEKITEAFVWDTKILIEPCIDAREIECSVTGNDVSTAYIPGEIIPSHEFYDYDAKYTDPNGAALKIPAEIDSSLRETVCSLATKAYEALDLTGLSRVDFFIDKKSQAVYLNEVNTIPGFTSISMFPKLCEASGLAYPDLIMLLLNLAVERFRAAECIKTDRTVL